MRSSLLLFFSLFTTFQFTHSDLYAQSDLPVHIYVSGGGLADLNEINRRVRTIKESLENGSNGKIAEVLTFIPDQQIMIDFFGNEIDIPFWSYSEFKINQIKNAITSLSGSRELHIHGLSMGAAILGDVIFPAIESEGTSVYVKSITFSEKMSYPGYTERNARISDNITFDLYVSYETEYIGILGDTFKELSNAGALIPDHCSSSSCYFLSSNVGEVSVNSPFTILEALLAHRDAVRDAELLGLSNIETLMTGIANGDYEGALIELKTILDIVQENQPEIPLPDAEEDIPPGGGGGGGGTPPPVSGGGGGGGGIESFPAWLSYDTYQKQKPKIGRLQPKSTLFQQKGDQPLKRSH